MIFMLEASPNQQGTINDVAKSHNRVIEKSAESVRNLNEQKLTE